MIWTSKTLVSISLALFLTLPFSERLAAHEIRPAFLEIKEQSEGNFQLKWKVPILNNRIPDIYPVFPGSCQLHELGNEQQIESVSRNFDLICSSRLGGVKLSIQNLEKTLIDVIVQIEYLSGELSTFMIQPDRPYAIIPSESNVFQLAQTFGVLGIEHILLGWDHLLFVLGLMLLVRDKKILLLTITSFTVAHSITLALSSLGHLSLPSAPVETIIALSVIFLAREYLSFVKGQTTLTVRYPWLIAFSFGLLHGFGFAGALAEIGIPRHGIFISLLTFNLGVEVGQVLFILILFLLYRLVIQISNQAVAFSLQKLSAYFIGTVASFWFIERMWDIAF